MHIIRGQIHKSDQNKVIIIRNKHGSELTQMLQLVNDGGTVIMYMLTLYCILYDKEVTPRGELELG